MAAPEEEVCEMKDEEEDDEEEDMEASSAEEGEETLQKAKQAITCRNVTLNTLMEDGIIQPGEGVLSIDYLGQRFEADLLESGKIKWQGSEEEFNTPSAWALHCKRLVNPVKRSGCGWASVKYKNKKLDIWKSTWARKQRSALFKPPLQTSGSPGTSGNTSPAAATTPLSPTSSEPTTANSTTVITSSTSADNTTSAPSIITTTDTSATTTGSVVSSKESQPPAMSVSPSSSLPPSNETTAATNNVTEKPVCQHGQKATKDMEVETDPVKDLPLKPVVTSPVTTVALAVTSTTDSSKLKAQLKTKVTLGMNQEETTTPLNLTTPLTSAPITMASPVISARKKDNQAGSPGVHSPRKVPGSRYDDGNYAPRERKAVPYSSLGTRTLDVDPHTLVKCEQFDSHSKIQPFTVSITSNSLLLMDFHCHLTKSEVVGYLGGRWDSHKQHLSIEQVFPACCRLGDKERAPLVEEEIRRSMRKKNQMIVGWYHSHPYCPPDPSIRDVDCQMAYQLKMRGTGCMYLPCVGFIVAPFEKLPPKPDSKIQAFWVMPNLEHQSSFNIPMHVSYSILRDTSLTEDLLSDMKILTEFYRGAVDRVLLRDHWGEAITYMDKIKVFMMRPQASLRSKLPEDQLDSGTFLDYVQQLLRDLR